MRIRLPASAILILPVFLPALACTLLLVIGTLSNPALAGQAFQQLLAFITERFGWFYLLSVALFLVFTFGIALTRWGEIKLGPDHATPSYSFLSWFAMLFSAGYGIGLLFFGVAEPVLHYAAPPSGVPETPEAARQAMQIAFFHWGVHIWAIYGLTGLVLAYFSFRHGLPLSLRSALYPLIGQRIHGPWGHLVDIITILGTLFGIATTLGLSVTQINAGLHVLWPVIPNQVGVQVLAILVIAALAGLSVFAGLDRGVKRLSQFNMGLAGLLMLFVFCMGPTQFILDTFLQNTGSYLSHLVERTFHLQAYSHSDWMGNWTLFIFGWTLSWAPFVGLFIARISLGRTIRQFVFGILLVPTLFTFLWFSIFGDTALHLIMQEGQQQLIQQVQSDHATALFHLFDQLPLGNLASVLTLVLIITFFVTSADSGALVIDSLAAGGAHATPAWQRLLWVALIALVAACLLLSGGLKALQTMSITSALPFTIILLLAAVGLWRALLRDGPINTPSDGKRHGDPDTDWPQRLQQLTRYPDQTEARQFLQQHVTPALHQVHQQLIQQGWSAHLEGNADNQSLTLGDTDLGFYYRICLRPHQRPAFLKAQGQPANGTLYYRAEVFLRRGGQPYDLFGVSQRAIIDDLLDQLAQHLQDRQQHPNQLPWQSSDNRHN